MRIVIGLMAAIICLCASQALACFAAPKGLFVHHKELVSRTETIILARVVGPSEKQDKLWGQPKTLAEFETVEILRGDAPKRFALSGGFFVDPTKYPDQDLTRQDFDGHRSLEFWGSGLGRTIHATDCEVHPYFVAGMTYLLFFGRAHWRGYEQIVRDDDLWLAAVRRLIANPDLSSGLTMPVIDWLKLSHAVFLVTVADCTGPAFTVDKVLHGSVPDTLRLKNRALWRKPCKVGQRFLFRQYVEKPESEYSFLIATHAIGDDGTVRFGDAISSGQIDVTGPKVWTVGDLERRF